MIRFDCLGVERYAKYIGCAHRLGERELALRHRAISDRIFLDPDQHIYFPQRCAVGPAICGRLRILDLLSARPAAADIGHRRESANSDRSSRFAPAQFAVDRSAPRTRPAADFFLLRGATTSSGICRHTATIYGQIGCIGNTHERPWLLS